MKAFLWVAFVVMVAGCSNPKLPEITAEVEATSLANVRTINLFGVSLYGEVGEKFNRFIETALRQRLAPYLSQGARWTLTILDVKYAAPHFSHKTPHYKLSLYAELVDVNSKQGWQATVETPELVAGKEWSEEQIRNHLAYAAVDALVSKLPLSRIREAEGAKAKR